MRASRLMLFQNNLKRILLICGLVSSLLYIGTDIFGAVIWDGYNYISQTISELSSIGSPSRPRVVPFFMAYAVLVIAFGFGIRESSLQKRSLRVTGVLVIIYGFICLLGPFVPMHQRGEGSGITDTLHIVATSVTVVFIFLILGFASVSLSKQFLVYTIITILLVLVFGSLTGLDGPRLAANEPTPWMGLTERINVYAFMIWIAVLSIKLWRKEISKNANLHIQRHAVVKMKAPAEI